jgi:CheY-like chemotaxis protein
MALRVLVVDDDPDVCSSLRDCLHDWLDVQLLEPLHVDTAGLGREAQLLCRLQPYDLVVSDLRMPGMSGQEFLAWLRREQPRTVRFLLTSETGPLAADAGRAAGARVFRKPGDLHRLLRAAREVLAVRDARAPHRVASR